MRRSCTRRTRQPGRTGPPKHPNRIGVRTGVPATRKPPPPATSPRRSPAGLRRKPHPRPQARWSVSRKAPAGRSRRVSPADGPRQARRREPDPSGSNLRTPRRSHRRAEGPAQPEPQFTPPPAQPEPQFTPPPEQPQQPPRIPWPPPNEAPRQPEQPAAWQPVSSEGQWLPPGAPGSNWNPGQPESPATPSWAYDNAPSRDKPSHRSPGIGEPAAEPPAERRGRHSSAPAESALGQTGEPDGDWSESGRRARSRHSVEQSDPAAGSAAPPPAMSPPPPPPPPTPPPAPDRGPAMSPPPPANARHRSTEAPAESEEPQSGGQSVADLLARLQSAAPSEGGRRRRRED